MTCDLHPEISRPCYVCGAARARAGITRTRRDRDTDPDPTRARAIERARTERTNAKGGVT